ncbi:MAG: ABC transporter substrate-binding protein [Rhizobiales bacterium]|nr:ABC transporter substrate-binding protein [Hyphomicrobiales bacterium]
MTKSSRAKRPRAVARRDILRAGAVLGGSALFGGWPARAAQSGTPRVAALGWSCAQTVLALGVVPLAVPEIERYRRLVVEPKIPAEVQEVGLRSEPNLELLQRLAPDVVVIDPSLAGAVSRLREIAPVEVFLVRAAGQRPLGLARASTLALARKLGKRAECEAYLERVDAEMERDRERLHGYDGAPLYIISEIVRNRALIFGPTSIYQDVLDRLGLKNAWTGESSIWGHATVGLETLAAVPEARCVLLSSRTADIKAIFALRPMMQSLPFLREERLTMLSEVLFYGGVPSAERFARLLAERLPKDRREQG